jgi:hypothetical protein
MLYESDAEERKLEAKMEIRLLYVSDAEEKIIDDGKGVGILYPAARCKLKCKFCWLNAPGIKNRPESFLMTPREIVDWVKANASALEYCGEPDWDEAREVYRLLRQSGFDGPVIFKGDGADSPAVIRASRCEGYINEDGADSPAALAAQGIFDIYLPDIKFADAVLAKRLCGDEAYPFELRAALDAASEIFTPNRYRQRRLQYGLLARHMILPGLPDNTRAVLELFAPYAKACGWPLHLSAVYAPVAGHVEGFPSLSRLTTKEEYSAALAYARALGIEVV